MIVSPFRAGLRLDWAAQSTTGIVRWWRQSTGEPFRHHARLNDQTRIQVVLHSSIALFDAARLS